MWIWNYILTTFFYLERSLKRLAGAQCFLITKGSICHFKHNVYTTLLPLEWIDLKYDCAREVSTMFGTCTYCVFTLYVRTNSIPTYDSWFQIHKDCSWYMFACSSFTEEGVKGIIPVSKCLVTWGVTVGHDTVLQTVKLPACIAHLNTRLANMDWNTFALWEKQK